MGWEFANQIWHSTYYSIPKKWQGAVVTFAYDMIYERFKESFNGPWDDVTRQIIAEWSTFCRQIICISEATRQDVISIANVPLEKTTVVHLAASSLFRQIEGFNPEKVITGKPFLLYIGERTHYKGFNDLLQAYAMWPSNKEIDLVVAGKPWNSQGLTDLQVALLMDKVHQITYPSDEVLCSLYNQALAFIYPSHFEGFGIPLLEAMNCGCLIVASDIPSTREIAGEIPIYFEATKIDSLLHALDQAQKEVDLLYVNKQE